MATGLPGLRRPRPRRRLRQSEHGPRATLSSMTTEHRVIVDVREVRQVRVRCTHCGAAISFGLAHFPHMRVPVDCPNCRKTISDPLAPNNVGRYIEEAVEALRRLRTRLESSEATNCSLEFELDSTTAPPADSST